MKKKRNELGLNLSAGKEKRRELDFYPTPPDATIALMDFLDLPQSIIWEPASGDGSMSEVIESYGHRVISTDIRSEGIYGQSGQDFLKVRYPNVDAIITNPPFNLAERFIRKATNEAKTVAMLLKSQYWHAACRMSLFNYSRPAYILPLTWRPDFLFKERKNGKKGSPTMEVLWAVWQRQAGGGQATHTMYQPLSRK